jgi:hypothetical protein
LLSPTRILTESRNRRVRFTAVRIRVVEATVARGEKLARRNEALLCEQRSHEAGERAAALMELHGGRAPGGERARSLAAGERERPGESVLIEAEEPTHCGR